MTGDSSRKTFRSRLDAMVHALREDIVSGRYKPGAFLPSERDIAVQYGLSNKSVRKALERLVEERLIEKIPRVGNRIVEPSSVGVLTLRFGCYETLWPLVGLESLLAAFHRRYPHIRVQAVPIPPGYYFEQSNRLVQDADLDVLAMSHMIWTKFAEQDQLASFETVAPNPQVYPFLNEALTYEGELKAQPLVFTPLVLCYNVDHFAEQRMPEPDSNWSWNDLYMAAKQLSKDRERLGFYMHAASSNRWPLFLLQKGVVFERDEEGRVHLQGTELGERLIACLDAYRALITMQQHVQLLSENDGDAEALFFDGKLSMVVTTYFSLNYYKETSNVNYDIAPLPYLDEARTLLMTVGLAMLRTSKVKESAKLLMDFLVSPEAQQLIRRQTLSIPSVKTAAEMRHADAAFHPSRFQLFREIMPSYRLLSTLGLNTQETNLFSREARLYWTGLSDQETLLRRLEKLLSRPLPAT